MMRLTTPQKAAVDYISIVMHIRVCHSNDRWGIKKGHKNLESKNAIVGIICIIVP